MNPSELIIDVGANMGGFALDVAARNPQRHVLALEPIPSMRDSIMAEAASRELHNVEVLQVAADREARMAAFHVADHADLGVSSLLEFDSERLQRDEYWKGREDLYFDHQIQVQVCRLDSLDAVRRAERIRFIKIDAQGVDLAVLESLGTYISAVEMGVLEVPSTLDAGLYAAEAHDLHSVLNWLSAHGFTPYAIKPNDHASREFNVFFHRRDVAWETMEQELGLRGLGLYDGKHYWHFPAAALTPDFALADSERVIERLSVVEAALARATEATAQLEQVVAKRNHMIQQLQQVLTQLR